MNIIKFILIFFRILWLEVKINFYFSFFLYLFAFIGIRYINQRYEDKISSNIDQIRKLEITIGYNYKKHDIKRAKKIYLQKEENMSFQDKTKMLKIEKENDIIK